MHLIYVFTGTGNSLAIALKLAWVLDANVASIARALWSEKDPGVAYLSRSLTSNLSDANATVPSGQTVPVPEWAGAPASAERVVPVDRIGMVFPVYHGSYPLIVKRFVEEAGDLSKYYVYAVCTCGDSPGVTMQHLADLIAAGGGELAAGYAVRMPYNYVTPAPKLREFYESFTLRDIPEDERKQMYAAADRRVLEIARDVAMARRGVLEAAHDPVTRLVERLHLHESLGKRVWLRVGGVRGRIKAPFIKARQRMDRAFAVTDACVDCGLCMRICPVYNIAIEEHHPTWQGHCEQCFACLQWCPQGAIQFGSNTVGQARYHHPEITVSDMLRMSP